MAASLVNAGDDGAPVPANIIKAVNEDRGKWLWIQSFEQLGGKQLSSVKMKIILMLQFLLDIFADR